MSETVAVRVRSVARSGINPGAAALALAVPFLFLHIKYQPGVRVPLGSTHLGLELSDAAGAVAGLPALPAGVRSGLPSLWPPPPPRIDAAAFVPSILIRSGPLARRLPAAQFSAY